MIMKPEKKTKQQLLAELATLHQRIEELEKLDAQRITAETSLLKSEEKYRTLLESTLDFVFTVDRKGMFTYINPRFEMVTGHSAADLIGRSFITVIPPESVEIATTQFKRGFRGEKDAPYEIEIIHKNGSRIPVEFNVTTLRDEHNQPVGRYGIGRDITGRKRVELVLKESEDRLQSIIQGSPIPMFVIDKEHRVVYWNRALEELSEIKAQEVIGTHGQWRAFYNKERPCMADLLVDEDFDKITEWYGGKYKKSDLLDEAYEALDFFPALGNRGRWLRFTAATIRDAKGNLIGAIETLEDMTGRKNAEDELRESQRLLSEIIEFLPDATLVIDKDGKVIAWNRAIEAMTGVKAEKMLGKGNYEYALPFYGDRRPILIDLALHPNLEMEKKYTAIQRQEDKVFGEAFTPKLPPGNVHLSATASVLRDSRGEIYAAIECIRDNTYRKQAEEALQKSEEKFRFITERMNDVIWTLDSHFMVQYVSPSVSKALGYTPEERIKQSIVERITPESFANVQEVLRRELRIDRESSLDPDRTVTLELEYYHKDGPTVWHESVISAIRDNGGNIIGYHGASRDITERKKIEKERQRLEECLRRAEKMEALGSLAGGVAHDLNNVLGVIVGYSELLREKIPAEDNLKRYVHSILSSSQRAAAIIQDLLTLARRGVAVSEVVNLNAVIYDYIKSPEFERLKAYHPYVTIETDVEKDLLHIKGSPVHLEKTLMNLVSNAVEAISDRGSVMIRTENRYLDKPIRGYDDVREGDYVVLTVSDTGKGISATEIEKIFEPFYTKKVMGRSGTGLGLTVVWGTVKDHDGYIDVHSEAENGSTFTIYFPATREELAGDQQEISPDQYMGRGESILVVDDIKEQRELAVAMLNRIGYHAVAVSTGEEAVSYIRTNKIDLMVLDMIMDPGIDGLETYRRILEINPKQKAIIVSGFSETERVKKAQEIGAGAYVRKPYILEKIGLAVKGELLKVNE
jgi:two-component system cell cycle sensor histidine kinase/response regulator CckA